MIKLGHMGFNSILSFPIGGFITINSGLEEGLIFMLGVVIIASLPDGDEFLNEQTEDGYLSLLPFKITHRGITHTLYFSLMMGLTASLLSVLIGASTSISVIIGLSLFCGTFFHVVGDSFTPMGVNILPPITQNISFGLFNYNNFFANVLTYIIGMLSIGVIFLIGLFELGFPSLLIATIVIGFITYVSIRKAEKSERKLQ